jgi:hypothetical protein
MEFSPEMETEDGLAAEAAVSPESHDTAEGEPHAQ